MMMRTRDDSGLQGGEVELKADHAAGMEAACSDGRSAMAEGVALEDEQEDENAAGVRGMTVAFQDIEYNVKNSAKWREKISILSKVSGSIPPGELTALMGPSGSGKTTLLDVLAGRKTVGTIKGVVVFAGHKPSRSFLRRYTGYVEQFDTLLDNLTVEEMLMYTAEMKNPVRESLASKKAKVALVLDQLALTSCASVRIGNALNRGISGGQSKRTNIGLALVTNPRVLFLDEPTSGLDSFTANEVMSVVKGLVKTGMTIYLTIQSFSQVMSVVKGLMKTGMTICATIHSPTPFCFRLFDRMMILLRGHMVYAGPNGEEAVRYFERTNPDYPRFGAGSTSDNTAEWIVDLTTKADRDGQALEFALRYAASDLAVRNAEALRADMAAREVSPQIAKELRARQGTSTPFYFGVKTILKYRLWRDLCDPTYLGPRVADKIVVGLILMSLYWHIGKENFGPNSVNIAAALFMVTILPAFSACAYTPQLVLERPVYYRERNDGCYTALAYLSAKILEEALVALLQSLVFACIVWFPLQLTGSFALFWYTYFQTTLIGILLAYFIAAISPNMDVANGALPAYIVINLFFVGLLIRPQDQPKYWHWFQYIDFLHYSWTAQMINQFEHTTIYVFLGIELLDFYDLRNKAKWVYVGYETVFIAVFFIFAWLALTFIRHQKR